MATRSIVCARTESGIKGVYVHWDGYPDGRLPLLQELIRRDGAGVVVRTIMGLPNGWSQLNAGQTDELEIGHQDGRFVAVPGYGVQYSDEVVELAHGEMVVQADTEYWTPKEDVGWAEYVYIINPDGTIDWAEVNGPFDRWRWKNVKDEVVDA